MSQESVEALLKAAKTNDPDACYKVGMGLLKGTYGLKRCPEKAPSYFKTSADSGNIDAINRYADIQVANKKYDEALKYYQLGVKQKNSYSMVEIGKILQDIKHDDEKSTKYFKVASSLNNPEGMYYYAASLFQQEQNEQAKELLRKSADLGYYESLHLLSSILKQEEDKKAANSDNQQESTDTELESEKVAEQYRAEKKKKQKEELYEKIRLANEENDAEAMIWLTEKFDKEPIRKNRLQALPYYKKLAKLQDIDSIRHLQLIYKYGRDVDPNINEYFKYTKLLADNGDVDSMIKISDLYKNGEGCEASEENHKAYREKAAEANIRSYKQKLAEISKKRNERKAKGKAANDESTRKEKENERETMNEIYKFSLQLLNGEVYLPNFDKSFYLLQILASLGHQESLNEVLNIMLRSDQIAPKPNEADIVKFLKLKKDDSYVLDLAHLFLNGNLNKLVLKQDGPVISYFKQFAIDKKDEKLLFKLANGYKSGKPPLEQNNDEYINLIKVLATLDNPIAIDKLRLIYEKASKDDTEKEPEKKTEEEKDKIIKMAKLQEMKRLKERADLNNGSNAFAMINYAKILIEGNGYIEPNIDEGIKYLKKAAEQCKNSTAMFDLGDIYENGKFVKQDLNEAIKYYSLGEENGNHQCAFYLVKCLLLANKGVEAKDAIKKSGDPDFSDKLFNKLLYEWKLEPDEVVRLLKIAADAGDVGSMKILSKYLMRGRNVTHNPDEATVYLNMYKKATSQ
ncbi:hypothetical protein M9Y10_034019 [Tritrichomonas musculus]|uniref:Uncharacterized protein n=1 Tax=Tritrichomonas musculus TaxID=1915356 RepID=A0ABR2KEE4_9EUKA